MEAAQGNDQVPELDLDALMKERVKIVEHPVLAHKLTLLRNSDTTNKYFRDLLKTITMYLGYEATADLQTKSKVINTPIAAHTGKELSSDVALIPILRSGLGMVDPMLDMIPKAKVHHLGMFRNKKSLLPVLYFNKLPSKTTSDTAIILEPTIATAGTINAVIDIVKEWGNAKKKIKLICVIASSSGIKALLASHPDIEIWVAAIDNSLSEDGQIVPGFGDAGDRQFNTYESVETSEAENGNASKRQRT